MPTKVYLLETASDINPGAELEKVAGLAANNLAYNKATNITAGGTSIQATDGSAGTAMTWLTPPLQAVTIAGTISPNIWGRESALTVNAGRQIKIEKTTGAGIVNATIVPLTAHGTEFGTTGAANAAWNITPTSTAVAAGERLKITLYAANVGTMAAAASGVVYTINGQNGALGDTWVQFAESLIESVAGTPAASLADNFDDNSIDATKWVASSTTGASVVESGGTIVLTAPSGATGNARLSSLATYDLMGSAIYARLVTAPSGTSVEGGIVADITPGQNSRYEMYVGGGTLNMRARVAGVASDTTTPYSATSHGWLRIRHEPSDDTVRFDVSPDGATWTQLRTVARGFSLCSIAPALRSANLATTATTGLATVFDNFNTTGVSGGVNTARTVVATTAASARNIVASGKGVRGTAGAVGADLLTVARTILATGTASGQRAVAASLLRLGGTAAAGTAATARAYARAIVASVTASGAGVRSLGYQRAVAATSGAVGTLARASTFARTFAATTTATGRRALVAFWSRSAAVTVGGVAAIARAYARVVAAAVTATGTLARGGGKALAAALSATAQRAIAATWSRGASVTASGATIAARAYNRVATATMSVAGILGRATAKARVAAVGVVGTRTTTVAYLRALAASVAATGQALRAAALARAVAVGSVVSAIVLRTFLLTRSATVGAASTLRRAIGWQRVATVGLGGSLARGIARTIASAVGAIGSAAAAFGAATQTYARTITATLGATATRRADMARTTRATVGMQISHVAAIGRVIRAVVGGAASALWRRLIGDASIYGTLTRVSPPTATLAAVARPHATLTRIGAVTGSLTRATVTTGTLVPVPGPFATVTRVPGPYATLTRTPAHMTLTRVPGPYATLLRVTTVGGRLTRRVAVTATLTRVPGPSGMLTRR